jgi:hypothetical protein
MAKKLQSYQAEQKRLKKLHAKISGIAELKKRRFVSAIAAEPGYELTVFAVGFSHWSEYSTFISTDKVIAWGIEASGKKHAITDGGSEAWYINNGCFFRSVVTFQGKEIGGGSLNEWKRRTHSEYEHLMGVELFVHWGENYPHSAEKLLDYYGIGGEIRNDAPDWVKVAMAEDREAEAADEEAHGRADDEKRLVPGPTVRSIAGTGSYAKI